MKTFGSFYEIPSVVHSQPNANESIVPGNSHLQFLKDKLPYNSGSGLYYNYIVNMQTGGFEYVSSEFIKLIGYDHHLFKKDYEIWQILINPDDFEASIKIATKYAYFNRDLSIHKKAVNQYSDNSIFRIRTRTGRVLTLLRQKIYFMLDESGNILYDVGIFIDITHFRSDGNLSMVIRDPEGKQVFEYYPKEDAAPCIAIVRSELSEIGRLAGETGNAFVRKIQAILAGQHADKTFNVKTLRDHLHLSRSQLYRQFEKTTGICPNRLIRLYRLHKSLEYLTHKELSISEVAWRVGFANPSWFSQCFYQEFDCTPSDYRHLMR